MEICHLNETTFSSLIEILMEQIEVVDQEQITPYRNKALDAMRDSDIDDAPILALAMALECPIWSNDEDLKEQQLVQVYKTKELLDLLETT